jgi:hypothetical protein
VTKFVGKFRKNQDYNDDYIYAKNFLHSKRRRGEHSEVKKQLKHWEDENFEELEISQGKKE